MAELELWGGIECTVNRVGDRYFDQVVRSGHHERDDDIARCASLGIRALRYPLLWERVAPNGLEAADWSWTDTRLAQIRDHGMTPIATLLHHGSGPNYTDLLDPSFPEHFANYAAAVAERYPWLTNYTPINEPLTTARFSALYGHWYPHARDDRAFVTALLNELRATTLAMARIRDVNPDARLIQTEDAGRTFSTDALAYQAAFENCRRWLTFDVLTGRVDDQHPLWQWLSACGASYPQLEAFLDQPCPPDIVGLNYYLTSDRYLDERVGAYPEHCHGGNGRDSYADVDAVRVPTCDAPAHGRVLGQAWERYQLPLALTETHAGCTREEQLRWLTCAWRAAVEAAGRGVDVRAVTIWSVFGAFDWHNLVTREDGIYEVGAFDVRSDPPRPTALAALAAALSREAPPPPLAEQPGWWHRTGRARSDAAAIRGSRTLPDRPIVITGANGTLGSAITRACTARGLHAIALSRQHCDITDATAVNRMSRLWRPWAIINAAGFVDVDAAETRRERCWQLNVDGARNLARAAALVGARYVTFSSDLVFDGGATSAYLESDLPRPLNVYGSSKHAAEIEVLAEHPRALVVRTAAFFGPVDRYNFLTLTLADVASGREVLAADDVVVSPTYVPHLTDAVLDLLIDGEHGIWHLINRGATSWADLATHAAASAGLDASLVRHVSMATLNLTARRPAFSALDSRRGHVMPTLEQGLQEYLPSQPVRAAIRPDPPAQCRWP